MPITYRNGVVEPYLKNKVNIWNSGINNNRDAKRVIGGKSGYFFT